MDQFREQGFLGPFTLCSPTEMGEWRFAVEAVLDSNPPDHKTKIHNRHLDKKLIWDLATDPAIIGRMQCLYGEDLLMWRTNFLYQGTRRQGDPLAPGPQLLVVRTAHHFFGLDRDQ